ncbi:hypothetical protein Ahy_B10g104263 [Arachis hypogaea]|uniref:Aminotransferase-like plant mobile domain-containing protein n=1 Tax=Arachis hypogaea TaxID=3818 RepID=A0A444X524_ARAHY|nr:hypothetical protein Ahy_B10g104263 [Arachis hypogaea]
MAISSTQVATQEKDKCPMAHDQAPPILQILNQINDEIIGDPQPQVDDPGFLSPSMLVTKLTDLERANKCLHYFPNAQGEDVLISQNLDISFFTNPQKPSEITLKSPLDELTSRSGTGGFRHSGPSTIFSLCTLNTPLDNRSCVSLLLTIWVQTNEPVTDDEHVAFLFYWLNAIVFCSRSVQMQKLFLPLAALLHEGNKFNLAKLILGHLFKELSNFVNCLRKHSLISIGGPLWLLQF